MKECKPSRGWLTNICDSMLKSRFLRPLQVKADTALILRSELFDQSWYTQTYPDVSLSEIEPALHYLLYGGFEGRNPGPLFDSDGYLDQNPNLRQAKINPLLHYLRKGKTESKRSNSGTPSRKGIGNNSLVKPCDDSDVYELVMNLFAVNQAEGSDTAHHLAERLAQLSGKSRSRDLRLRLSLTSQMSYQPLMDGFVSKIVQISSPQSLSIVILVDML
ncbi:MAG: hypothetical protein IPM23_00045 [Candidatus Melainabacteria bacterium]|nr:hypothetical protein [Candidatus Melainabacteria bacterium]